MEKHSSPNILIAFACFKNTALWFLMRYVFALCCVMLRFDMLLYSLSLSFTISSSLPNTNFYKKMFTSIPLPKEKISILAHGFRALQTGLRYSSFFFF